MTETKLVDTTEPIQVIELFDTPDSAERAYDHLLRMGYNPDEINVLMSAETHKLFKSGNPVAATAVGTEVLHASEKVLGAAGASSAAGALSGVIAGIGASLLVPGMGLVVLGPLAALGAGLGAALGAMYGIAFGEMAENKTADYEAKIRQGKILISTVPHSPADQEEIRLIWKKIRKSSARGVNRHE